MQYENMITVSYSGLGSYNKCPNQFARRYVYKEPVEKGPPSPPMQRGLEIHESIEDVINGKNTKVHSEIVFYQEYVSMLAAMGAIAEAPFNFGQGWEARPFEDVDGWGTRGFLDCHVVPKEEPDKGYVQEWKTGKAYDDHSLQRDLYGLSMFLMYPDVQTVKVDTIYLDQKDTQSTEYSRDKLVTYKWVWERKINKVQPPQKYPMRPGWWCRGCPYSTRNGGSCPN